MSTPSGSMSAALLNAFYATKKEETPSSLIDRLNEVFTSRDTFIKKIKTLDTLSGDFKLPDDIGELLFDLLLYNFFSEDSQRLGESFFESKEWEQIEDVIIDRGTDLMNIKFSIDDYLDEYLISEDDFDSEEHEVYEAVIKNRDSIVLGDLQTMLEISKANTSSPLGDQLLPVLLFFESKNSIQKKQDLILKEGSNPAFQSAFLAVLSSF